MSLTSYRAAPPRDKPLRAFAKNRFRNGFGQRPKAPIDPVRRLPEKATRANALGCERYVPTQGGFGKAHRSTFEYFMTVKTRDSAPKRAGNALLPEVGQKQSLKAKKSKG